MHGECSDEERGSDVGELALAHEGHKVAETDKDHHVHVLENGVQVCGGSVRGADAVVLAELLAGYNEERVHDDHEHLQNNEGHIERGE